MGILLNSILFSGFTTILCWGMFSWTSRNNHPSQSRYYRNLRNHFGKLWIVSIRYKGFEGTPCVSVASQYVQMMLLQERVITQCSAKGLGRHICSNWLLREKGISVQLRYVKRTEEEFLFSTRKFTFSGTHRLCFLSEASWKIVIFVFILFSVYFIFISIFYVIVCFFSNFKSECTFKLSVMKVHPRK